MLKVAFAMKPVNDRGFHGAKDVVINGVRSSPGQTVDMLSVANRPKNGNGNSASSRETKGTTPERKSNGNSSKKKKLMAGGQDELSILASMGILDRDLVLGGKSSSSDSANDKWQTSTDNDVSKDQPNTAKKTNKKIKRFERAGGLR